MSRFGDIERRATLTGTAAYYAPGLPRALSRHDRLKEGHFDEWLPKVLDLLCKYDLSSVVYNIINGVTTDSDFAELQISYAAAHLIQASVRPHFLERIGLETRRRAVPLVQLLRKHCQPFRIMDLPPEMRVRVYEMVPDLVGHTTTVKLKSQPKSDNQTKTKPKPKKKTAGRKTKKSKAVPEAVVVAAQAEVSRTGTHYIPGITQANQQLRAETRPVFFANGVFAFEWPSRPLDRAIQQGMVRAWLRDVVQGDR